MAVAEWTRVLDDRALSDGAMAPVRLSGERIVLSRVAGALYAVADTCVHMGCALSRGTLDGYILMCPCHDWRFDIRTGRFLDAPELGLKVYPVKSEAGGIFVRLE